MKTGILSAMLLSVISMAVAQPRQQPVPLPRQIIARPQANVKILELTNVIEGRWRGARITTLAGGLVNVDSVWIEFKINGTLTFKHQQYEFNGPNAGTYTISKNAIQISIVRFPFAHALNGNWNTNTGILSGQYSETRDNDATQPSYYIPGSNTGSFNLTRY